MYSISTRSPSETPCSSTLYPNLEVPKTTVSSSIQSGFPDWIVKTISDASSSIDSTTHVEKQECTSPAPCMGSTSAALHDERTKVTAVTANAAKTAMEITPALIFMLLALDPIRENHPPRGTARTPRRARRRFRPARSARRKGSAPRPRTPSGTASGSSCRETRPPRSSASARRPR